MRRRRLGRVPEPEVMDDATEARAYREGDFRRVNRAFVRRLLRTVPASGGRALDLGTGPGEIPRLFCELAPGWRVLAVDLSPAMLRLAEHGARESAARGRLEFRQGDAKDLRLRRRFDLVFSNSLLHHLPDPDPFWRGVRHRTAPGGRVVVMDLRRPPSRARARDLVRHHARDASPLLRELFHRSLLAAFTPAEVRAQLRAAGLDGLEVRATTDRHLVVQGIPAHGTRGPARRASR